MNIVETISFDRIRRSTPKKLNELIDLKREISLEYYKDADIESIRQRIKKMNTDYMIHDGVWRDFNKRIILHFKAYRYCG